LSREAVQTNRLFFALLPDDETRSACQRAARELMIKYQPTQRRVVPPENYHVTLEFLGHTVTTEQEAGARASAALVSGEPFTMALEIAASFAGASVWWLGPRETPTKLLQFRGDLHKRLGGLGLNLDRGRFSPHVTVIKTGAKLPPTMIAAIDWTVSDFALMRSQVDADGSKYEVLQRWPIQATCAEARKGDGQLSLL
jgi:2'-5' RNA ligase